MADLRGVVEGFGEDSATIQGIVNDLANCCHVGVYVHAVARTQMPVDTLSRDFESPARQLRVSARLDVVDHLQPL
jgi:hypothetical protein